MELKIAENIKALRKQHSFTQEQLAEALGVTVGAVYKWEAGLSVPEIKLIMELADLFEISVDVLLGYEQQCGKVENRILRIKQCLREKDFEEAVSEAEKALKKYPNHFEVVYACAMMYMLKFSEDKCENTMIKSNELFQTAISLLYQNTNHSIHEATIQNYMAGNYLLAQKTEQGLEILKQNNVCNINSSLIGYIYAVNLKQPALARPYLLRAFSDMLNHTIRTMAGMTFMYAHQKDETGLEAAKWLCEFFDSLKEDKNRMAFTDKFKAVLLAWCAVWEAGNHRMEEAREYTKNAFQLAQQFDAAPIYSMQGIKFLKGGDAEGVSYDDIGKTAMEAVENFVFSETEQSEAQKYVKGIWEEMKHGACI